MVAKARPRCEMDEASWVGLLPTEAALTARIPDVPALFGQRVAGRTVAGLSRGGQFLSSLYRELAQCASRTASPVQPHQPAEEQADAQLLAQVQAAFCKVAIPGAPAFSRQAWPGNLDLPPAYPQTAWLRPVCRHMSDPPLAYRQMSVLLQACRQSLG